jgi:NAD+-dependent protein deacetylase sirtuin 5
VTVRCISGKQRSLNKEMLLARLFPKHLTEFHCAIFQTRPLLRTASMATIYGPSSDVKEFGEVLKSSKRVLALCGAGLSAASGLDTFRGAGGMWRNHEATTLATPEAFERDPGLVWLFYAYRRHKALQAKPNAGHYALTELSKKMPDFITLTQNVDGKAF